VGVALIEALRVRDLATIEELTLEPGPGLNVLTGETGAGKSVLLGAIALLAGRRVSKEVVRSGAAEASVEAIFADGVLLERARELGLAGEDDAQVLVARSISAEGRGRVWINGRMATAALLAELLGDTLEIVSQGEHLSLLRPEVQLELLDRHGGLEPLAGEVASLHRAWRELAAEIERRRAQAAELARREDQLRFEIDQIERAAPRPDELDELEREHRRLAHVERLGRDAERALDALEGSGGAREGLAQASSALRGALELDPALAEPAAALERAALELDEATRGLERYRASLEVEPGRLEQVEVRLGELRRLQSRYGPSIEAILDYRRRAQEEYERIAGGERRTAELEAQLAQRAAELESAARRLSSARAQVGAELAAAVTAELAAVDLAKARFDVAFEPVTAKTPDGQASPSGPTGRETVSFQLAANPGEKPRRLRDAVSGGELARLLLALRNVLRGAESARVLLFDEVDAGVGGRAASRVGERLRRLGAHHQVLCITHLPQVAALGDRHFLVTKRVSRGRTRSAIEELAGELRVDEIARMAAGGRVTEVSRAHARELLSRG
jgi:DNA repair protein RecN (Recombination protein N)